MTMRVQGWTRAGERFATALAVIGLLAGGAACVTAPTRPVGFAADHTVSIVFKNGCPDHVVVPAAYACPNRRQCMKVGYREQVLLQTTTPEPELKPTDDKFAVQFDPFQGPPAQGVGFVLLTVKMNAKQGASKLFPYNVQSGTCTPLDPDFQVDW